MLPAVTRAFTRLEDCRSGVVPVNYMMKERVWGERSVRLRLPTGWILLDLRGEPSLAGPPVDGLCDLLHAPDPLRGIAAAQRQAVMKPTGYREVSCPLDHRQRGRHGSELMALDGLRQDGS